MEERRRQWSALLAALAVVVICSPLMAGETTLAGISIGQGAKDIVRLYGEPADKDSDPDLGSTCWFYSADSHGTKLMFEVMPGDIVFSILVAGGPNPAIKTGKGVRLGDPIAKVTEAYGPQTPEPVGGGAADSMLHYTEGSAMVFFLQDERVVQIDLLGDPEVVLPGAADWMVSDFRKQGNGEAEARAATGARLKEHGYYPAAIAEYQRALALTPKSCPAAHGTPVFRSLASRALLGHLSGDPSDLLPRTAYNDLAPGLHAAGHRTVAAGRSRLFPVHLARLESCCGPGCGEEAR